MSDEQPFDPWLGNEQIWLTSEERTILVFALGMALTAVKTGELPEMKTRIWEVARKLANQQPPRPPRQA